MFEHNETLEQARARNIADALREDIGVADWTARLTPAGRRVRAQVRVREAAVCCGQPWFDGVFAALDATARLHWQVAEGARMEADRVILDIEADGRALLSAERSALNFLQLLSGVATLTRQHVDAIAGASPNPRGCAVLDTRKTLPGLRLAQKYAVAIGGGTNHRVGLYDGILVKENHIIAAGGIREVVEQASAIAPSNVFIEVEVETLEQMREALEAGVKMILLDNMTLEQMREAVTINAGRAELEASGGVNLERVRAIAETGVDRISIGTLTKDVRALDLSLRHVER